MYDEMMINKNEKISLYPILKIPEYPLAKI